MATIAISATLARVSHPGARARRNRPASSSAIRTTSGDRARGASLVARGLNTDKSYNCVVNADGVIISDDFPSGTYEVSAWWAGATKDGEEPLAPRCDSERQRGCEVRCEMTAEGELVCEGLSSGTYRVINAKDAEAECSVKDGAFECTTSFDEDDGPIQQDTGDLNMIETQEDHGIRLGG
jgi:hypothetical protein